jgi:hypothetical protein
VTTHRDFSIPSGDSPVHARTELSLEFEAHWRSLPKDGLVPRRSAFRPERAPKFLRHIILGEIRLGETPAIQVLLGGTEYESRVRQSMKGENYLNFVSDADRPRVLATVREVVKQPCGHWQIRQVHYARSHSQLIETTTFPLRADDDGEDLIIVLTQPLGLPIMPESTDGKVTKVNLPDAFQYIDLGAGVSRECLYAKSMA